MVSGAIARRDIHAAAERDREVDEVPTHASALLVPIGGGAVAPSVAVAEFDPVESVVADRLSHFALRGTPRPAGRCPR
jgi:hypothetical protein